MAPDGGSPYDAAIVDVENRIRNLQTTLETLKQLRAQAVGDVASALVSGLRQSDTEIAHDTFFGMTITEAAKKYLTIVKCTKSTAEICSALERGGLKHASKDFQTTVRSVIGPKDEFVRVNGDWGLTEWYPGMGRGKKPKPDTKKAQKPKPESRTAKPEERRKEQGNEGTRKERVKQVMRTDPTKAWTAGEVSKLLNDRRRLVQAMMSIMAKDGELEKGQSTGYHLSTKEAAA